MQEKSVLTLHHQIMKFSVFHIVLLVTSTPITIFRALHNPTPQPKLKGKICSHFRVRSVSSLFNACKNGNTTWFSIFVNSHSEVQPHNLNKKEKYVHLLESVLSLHYLSMLAKIVIQAGSQFLFTCSSCKCDISAMITRY